MEKSSKTEVSSTVPWMRRHWLVDVPITACFCYETEPRLMRISQWRELTGEDVKAWLGTNRVTNVEHKGKTVSRLPSLQE
jgi:hypothetical protein